MSRCAPSDWVPGLHHGEKTLREVLDTLPGIAPTDIPWVVRFFENPSSRWALMGATTLFCHDCIHVMLGRGLSAEDEAFVLGFTMGQASTPRWFSRAAHYRVFRFVSRWLYPKSLRLSRENLRVYDLGIGFGERNRCQGIEFFPFEWYMDDSVASLRQRLHIEPSRLQAFNRFEQLLSPGAASSRLDINDVDHSHLTEPQ